MTREQAHARFGALVAQDEIPLDEALGCIAAEDQDGRDVTAMLAELDELASELEIPDGLPMLQAVARLNRLLFEQHGFKGDPEHYDDPRNSFLDRVLERRRGLPILLCIVYMEVARRAGLAVEGIGFPGHFLVAPVGGADGLFVDPFHGGATLRRDGLRLWLQRFSTRPVADWEIDAALRPADHRAILFRVNTNLKGSYFRRGDLGSTLRAVDRLLLLQPDHPEIQQERAWLKATMRGD